jgi:hypothetical protein
MVREGPVDRPIVVWKNVGLIRGLAMALVVANHAVLRVRGFRLDDAPGGWGGLEAAFVVLAVTVPPAANAGFMIASGYFLGRFGTAWRTALVAARGLAVRWASWSVLGFAFLLLTLRTYTVEQAWSSLTTTFGPFQAYWFLFVLIPVMLLAPALARWAQQRPRGVAATVLALEAVRAAGFYTGVNRVMHVVPLEMSWFLVGFLLAGHTDAALAWVARRGRVLAGVTGLLLLVALAETALWWRLDGGPSGNVVSGDRLAMRLFALSAALWAMLRPTPEGRWTRHLDGIGKRSLAVLLLFDLFQHLTLMAAWHAPALLGGGRAGPPAWLGSLWFTGVYLAAGLLGPLAARWLVERLAGRRWSQAVFG